MVVENVIRYWVAVFTLKEAGKEGLRDTVQDLEAYFYADNRIIALPRKERSQRSFDVLTHLINQVGL